MLCTRELFYMLEWLMVTTTFIIALLAIFVTPGWLCFVRKQTGSIMAALCLNKMEGATKEYP